MTEASHDKRLTLDDAVPVFELFKPRIREVLGSVPSTTIDAGKELVVDITVEALKRLSRGGFRMIADRIQDRINDDQ